MKFFAAETVQEARDVLSAGRKNFIINGDFGNMARGTSCDGLAMVMVYLSVDRFLIKKMALTNEKE